MLKLYILMAFTIGMAYMYDKIEFETRFGKSRPWFIYVPIVAVLICFNGLRGAYNDTWNYRDVYDHLTKGFPEAWDDFSWSLGSNPAFELIQSFFKTYNIDVHLFLFFFGFCTILLYMRFLRRHSVDFPLTMYFFFTMGCYMFTLAAMKQCMAIAICMLAVEFIIKKKYLPFILLVGIASLFHIFVVIFLVVPFLDFRPWSGKMYVFLVILFIGCLAIGPMINMFADAASSYNDGYNETSLTGEGVNVFRIIAASAPIILSFFYKEQLFSENTRQERIFMNACVVYFGIQLMGLFGTAMVFVRMSNYFMLFPAVTLPWMFSKMKNHAGDFIKIVACCCYFAFFYITESYPFSAYEALTLSQFGEILFDTVKGLL